PTCNSWMADTVRMSSTSQLSPETAALRRSLDALARRGIRRMRQWRFRQAVRDALAWSPVALAAVPLGALAGQVAAVLAGRVAAPLPSGWLAALSFAGVPLFIALLVAWDAIRFRPLRAAALALHDENGNTGERLVTADEFIAS